MSLHAHAGELYSLGCALIWAVAVLLFRKSGEHVPPVVLNLFKNTVGLVMFAVTLAVLGVPLLPADQPWSAWVQLLLSGVLGVAVADSLFFASLNRLGASNTAIVDCFYSPFVVVSAFFFLKEDIRGSVLVAVLLMAGAILLGTWEPRGQRSHGERRQVVEGVGLGIAAMLFTSVSIVLAKPPLATADPWWATTVRLLGGMAVLAVQGLRQPYRDAARRCFTPGRLWWITVPAALTGSYVALIMWIMGIKLTPASTAGVLNQTSTIFILILAGVFLDERITARKTAAIVMAFAGAVLVTV